MKNRPRGLSKHRSWQLGASHLSKVGDDISRVSDPLQNLFASVLVLGLAHLRGGAAGARLGHGVAPRGA
eukprot:scaffold59438_cov59-Phaeocystis_antarctica.AAC.1